MCLNAFCFWRSRQSLNVAENEDATILTNNVTAFNNTECTRPEPIVCPTQSRYRSVTGVCNNVLEPLKGAALTPFRRLLPADYSDGNEISWSTLIYVGNDRTYYSNKIVKFFARSRATNHLRCNCVESRVTVRLGTHPISSRHTIAFPSKPYIYDFRFRFYSNLNVRFRSGTPFREIIRLILITRVKLLKNG